MSPRRFDCCRICRTTDGYRAYPPTDIVKETADTVVLSYVCDAGHTWTCGWATW